jgi:hypothetical protein
MWERADNQDVGLEAATIERVRNSSLVQGLCAENVTGLNTPPKLWLAQILRDFAWVGERRMRVEVRPEGLVDCIRVRMPV